MRDGAHAVDGPAATGTFVLAIDQGTSATKAVVIDGSGAVVARATCAVGQSFPRPGWAEQDGHELADSARRAVADCLAALPAGTGPDQVATLALSTQRESVLLWDRATGVPLGPVLGWQDIRAAGVCAELVAAGHGLRVRELTGLPLDAMFSAAKARALLDLHDPERTRSRAGELCLGTIDSWLVFTLTGEHRIETGCAARTQLLDIARRAWDPWLLDLFGVPAEILPTVTASTGPFGTVRGLHPDLDGRAVTGVLGDSHAALFAHAGWVPGRVKATYGTGCSVMGVAPGPVTTGGGIARTLAWELDEPRYALEGNIRSSGATLVWLARLFGTTVEELLSTAADDAEGVTLVPAFTGLGAPWWDENAAGLVAGLSESTGPGQLARAALESIAFQVADVVAAVEESAGPVEVVLADGGPSANPTLMQLQADLAGRRVEVSAVRELSAVGAAQLAGVGAGLWTLADLERRAAARTPYLPADGTDRESRLSAWHAAVDAARRTPRRNP
ncbi:FGGY family carbohydrate kinase [Kineococcus gynurae]|uniref:ATP:glycerol 3-phosphotransferase n=1 Tax=Kineococcus gynurae TaxID=452979 RepID=A0ABV5LWD0_9ACTN